MKVKVKILRSLGRGFPPYKENQELELDQAEAERLIGRGLAAPLAARKKAKTEQPTKAAAEPAPAAAAEKPPADPPAEKPKPPAKKAPAKKAAAKT